MLRVAEAAVTTHPVNVEIAVRRCKVLHVRSLPLVVAGARDAILGPVMLIAELTIVTPHFERRTVPPVMHRAARTPLADDLGRALGNISPVVPHKHLGLGLHQIPGAQTRMLTLA